MPRGLSSGKGIYDAPHEAKQTKELQQVIRPGRPPAVLRFAAALSIGRWSTPTLDGDMDTPAELPDIETHHLCRSCSQWLAPMYGAVRQSRAGTFFSPGSVRLLVDAAAGRQHTYFECYDCQGKKKRRRLYVYGALSLLIGMAIAVREFVVG
jgi:hypothetical protein